MNYPNALSKLFLKALRPSVLLLGAFLISGADGAPKQATNNSSLSGQFFAHDLYEVFNGSQVLGRGFRTFNANGIMSRLFTYPSSTPLDLEIAGNGTYRLSDVTFDGGFSGTIGLGGELAVFTLERPRNSDPQVRDGYASLQLSAKQSSTMSDGDFDGSYSYHALLRLASGTYQNSFGVASSTGNGSYFIIRESAVARTFSYDVETTGLIALGRQVANAGAILADGDLIVNTAEVGSGDDGEASGGYTGLALYVRRFPDSDAGTDDFAGTYRIHQITADGSATPQADSGSITAGGDGFFFGTLVGTPYSGRINLNTSGTFTLEGEDGFQGTLGAGGDIAVVTGSDAPSLALWIRTAGGRGNSIDGDGDGLTDSEEAALGTDPNRADSDGDGLLDNTDERPNTPDNVVSATLSNASVSLSEDDTEDIEVTLTLDSDDFPFFAWTLDANVAWLIPEQSEGLGDGDVILRIDVSALEEGENRATMDVIAPAMAPLSALTLTVEVISSQADLIVEPTSLHITVMEGGSVASRSVSLSSPEGDSFTWRAEETPTWLDVTPDSGSGPGNPVIEIDPGALLVAESPYMSTVVFVPDGSGPKQAAVEVTVDVLSPRDVDTDFPLAPSEDAQSQPALAFDTTGDQWLLTWIEDTRVLAMFLDTELVPVSEPLRVSFDGLGLASNPSVTVVDGARQAWLIWEQRESMNSDGLVQARVLDLDDRTLGNGFGFTTGSGNKSLPSAAYNQVDNEVVVVFNREFNDQSFIGFARLDGSTRVELASGFAAASNNHQSQPAVAWLPGSNAFLFLWREIIERADSSLAVQIRAVRIDGATGNTIGSLLILDDDAPNADNLRVVASRGLDRWVVVWSESPLPSLPGRLHSLSVSGEGAVTTIYTASENQRSVTPVELSYNENSRLLAMLWSENPAMGDDVASYQYVAGSGLPLGGPVALPGEPRSASSAAVGANPDDNEFLLVWEDPATAPRQLRALRISGGSGDVDEDGLPNEWEASFGLDPNNPDGDDGADGDPDRDGLSNLAEFLLGTDPTDPDGDGDGLLDGQEDTNSDGVIEDPETSPLNPDSDDDGIRDDVEWFLGSNGADPESTPETGIYRVAYGAWRIGEPGTLTVSFYVSESGSVSLQVNPDDTENQISAPGWILASEDNGAPRVREPGVYYIEYTITPTEELTPTTTYGTFRFVLRFGEGDVDSRTAVLVADLLDAHDGEGDDSAASLAASYAPVLRLHRDALFAPIPVELSMGTATFDPGNTMPLRVAPAPIDLHQSPYTEAFIDLPGEDVDALFTAYPEIEDRPDPGIYYTVTALGDGSAESGADPAHRSIQYYLHFYADVGGLDQSGGHRHEGDWEVFQILLDENDSPYHATATQQSPLAIRDSRVAGGLSSPWNRLETTGENRPVIYVGKGSHGLYFKPGATSYPTGADVHDGVGYWLLPERDDTELLEVDYDLTMPLTLTPLARLYDADAARWLRFPGKWGQPNFPVPDTDSTSPAVDDGPAGPAFMGTTDDGTDTGGVRRIWSDPFAFATRMPMPVGETSSQIQGSVPETLWGETIALMGPRGRIYFGEIDGEAGTFDILAPVQNYQLAAVSYDGIERPELLATAQFDGAGVTTPLFAATEGLTALGHLSLTEGILTGSVNFSTLDTDGDGIVNSEDPDMDGDGIANDADDDMLGDGWRDLSARKGEGARALSQRQDPDGDGIPSFLDADDDGDGEPDETDADRNGNGIEDSGDPGDVDGDGFFDVIDLDQDNDGFDDATEIDAGSDPRHYLDSPLSQVGDIDGDGNVDAADGQRLVNQGLGRAPYTPRADYNLDGAINAIDLQMLVNDILAISP